MGVSIMIINGAFLPMEIILYALSVIVEAVFSSTFCSETLSLWYTLLEAMCVV